ncbi:LemA family protein [Ignatzschineria sp. LJL83]
MTIWIISLSIIGMMLLMILFYGITIYNTLVKKQQIMSEAFMMMNVFLTKRQELIPALITASQKMLDMNMEGLQKLMELAPKNSVAIESDHRHIRHSQETNHDLELSATQAIDQTIQLAEKTEQELALFLKTATLSPNLMSDQGLQAVYQSLQDVEKEISQARRYYNATVRDYMTYFSKFPNIFIAVVGKFPQGHYFYQEGMGKGKMSDNTR